MQSPNLAISNNQTCKNRFQLILKGITTQILKPINRFQRIRSQNLKKRIFNTFQQLETRRFTQFFIDDREEHKGIVNRETVDSFSDRVRE
ncbi:hypothetical protein Scep_025474 [Stephania cephalantha]|uniref:Uncharacterized protein n=1 Tax=Stephania cephalantha TaxID=152367 RepID=A0AAP0HSH3_9MAGN